MCLLPESTAIPLKRNKLYSVQAPEEEVGKEGEKRREGFSVLNAAV